MWRSRKVIQASVLIFLGLCSILFIVHFIPGEEYYFMNTTAWRCDNDGTILETLDASLCLGHHNIFFVESSGSGVLNPRQACAVESAARHHPSRDVRVLMMSLKPLDSENDLMRIFEGMPNVSIIKADFQDVASGTPLWDWYQSGMWKRSKHKVLHLSDALRLLLVWKYGGAYMDLDIVVLRSLEEVVNSTVSDNGENSANGFLFFDREHPFLRKCLIDFASTYDPKQFAENGPLLITRNIKDFCGVAKAIDAGNSSCGIRVLPMSTAFPIDYERWEDYFRPAANVSAPTDLRSSLLIHVWNMMSRGRKLEMGGDSLYETAMREHCPITHEYAMRVGHI